MKIPSPGSSLEAWEEVDDSSEEEERKQPLTTQAFVEAILTLKNKVEEMEGWTFRSY